jgi:hypothetical protein
LENFHEIISEVYANNHQELAPCLDGLGAEALQEASSSTFSQMNFQGSGLFLLIIRLLYFFGYRFFCFF